VSGHEDSADAPASAPSSCPDLIAMYGVPLAGFCAGWMSGELARFIYDMLKKNGDEVKVWMDKDDGSIHIERVK